MAAPYGPRAHCRRVEEETRAGRCLGEDRARPVLPDRRKPAGGAMTTGEDLGAALADLGRASRHQLAAQWAGYFGAPPPPRTSRALLLRAAAYKLKVRELGWLVAVAHPLLRGPDPKTDWQPSPAHPRHECMVALTTVRPM